MLGVYWVMHKKTGKIFYGIKSVLSTTLIDEKGSRFLQCELGPACDFEVIGEV